MGNASSSAPPKVPADMLAEKRAGWHAFTQATVLNCVAVAGVLLLMLVFLRIL